MNETRILNHGEKVIDSFIIENIQKFLPMTLWLYVKNFVLLKYYSLCNENFSFPFSLSVLLSGSWEIIGKELFDDRLFLTHLPFFSG